MRKSPQLTFKKVNGWGGKRKNAGRPNKSGRINHMKRPKIKASTPLHLTWRLKNDLVNLRCDEVQAAFQKAAQKAKKLELRLLHYSLQHDHIHLIAEANGNQALKRAMRSFGCSFGKAIRKIRGGKGSVFDGRFHLEVLDNPTQVRNAMAYVLQNFSKHNQLLKHVDRYSSAPYFGLWRKLLANRAGPILTEIKSPPPLPEFLSPPKSWLAQAGWMKARTLRSSL